MTYEEAMARLAHAAMFPKTPGLTNMRALLERLGHPEERLRFVHIAGTNGKGSTAAFLSAALSAAGMRTGRFCSPYVERFPERIAIDGAPIPEAEVGRLMADISAAAEGLPHEATFFELVTALGLRYFLEQGCEIVALEVGLGGALDPTNVIPPPLLALITKIGLDHTAVLGRTAPAIAREKAGILKPGSEAILLAQSAEVEAVIRAAAEAVNIPLSIAAPERYHMEGARVVLEIEGDEALPLGPLGRYQAENASLAYAAIARLRAKGFAIPDTAVREGFSSLRWPGRFILAEERPPLIIDGAHNPLGAEALSASLAAAWPDAMRERKAVFLVGMMRDKDCDGFLRALAPHARGFIATAPESPRALPAAALAERMREIAGGTEIHIAENPRSAWAALRALTLPDGLGVACGSLYLVSALD